MTKTYSAELQDGGLWFIYDKSGKLLGAVFNRGYSKQDRIKDECEPGNPWGIATTFSGAVSLVFQGSRYTPSAAQIALEKVQSELQSRANDLYFLLPNHGAILS